MGSVFARGLLRPGHPVYPLVRHTKTGELARQHAEPDLVVIAVAEKEIQTVLREIPEYWRDRLVLLQNELLPDDWSKHKLEPSVISVWFEKKKGMDSKVIIPSPVFGKHAQLVADALSSIDISTKVLGSAEECLYPDNKYRRPENRWNGG